MRLYVANHGNAPTNWTQVAEVVDLEAIDDQSLVRSADYPLQDNYVFVTNEIQVPGDRMGKLVMIRLRPIKRGEGELEQEGRYLIFQAGNVLKHTWLSEDQVQRMLADAGVKELPKPEPLNAPEKDRDGGSTNRSGTRPLAPPAAETGPNPITSQTGFAASAESPSLVENSVAAGQTPDPETSSSGLAMSWVGWVVALVIVVGIALVFVFTRHRAR